jgi:hypothetical protein
MYEYETSQVLSFGLSYYFDKHLDAMLIIRTPSLLY